MTTKAGENVWNKEPFFTAGETITFVATVAKVPQNKMETKLSHDPTISL